MTLKLTGVQGKILSVDGDMVKIIKVGGIFASQREKTIPIQNISSIEVKKPGVLINGFIQLSIAGGVARESSYTWTGGVNDALKDENSVVFVGDDNYQLALQIKTDIESKMARTAPSAFAGGSVADELLKFKGLLDAGLLTQDEFDSIKKRLLGASATVTKVEEISKPIEKPKQVVVTYCVKCKAMNNASDGKCFRCEEPLPV
ncbi:MAG: hypothetical protein Q7T62_18360 [Undibacterium sp.]|nr:hypothetical protein [Undibacterium sp.]